MRPSPFLFRRTTGQFDLRDPHAVTRRRRDGINQGRTRGAVAVAAAPSAQPGKSQSRRHSELELRALASSRSLVLDKAEDHHATPVIYQADLAALNPWGPLPALHIRLDGALDPSARLRMYICLSGARHPSNEKQVQHACTLDRAGFPGSCALVQFGGKNVGRSRSTQTAAAHRSGMGMPDQRVPRAAPAIRHH